MRLKSDQENADKAIACIGAMVLIAAAMVVVTLGVILWKVLQ